MERISQSGAFNETTSLEILDTYASVSSVLSVWRQSYPVLRQNPSAVPWEAERNRV